MGPPPARALSILKPKGEPSGSQSRVNVENHSPLTLFFSIHRTRWGLSPFGSSTVSMQFSTRGHHATLAYDLSCIIDSVGRKQMQRRVRRD
jgi:hypothetical protein